MNNSSQHNLYYLDVLRVLATFGVVVLHTSANMLSSIASLESTDWWIAHIFDSSVRWSVPVFVLVSGALLLDPSKTESIKTFFTKRANRILLPLFFWSVFFSVWKYSGGNYTIKDIIVGNIYGTLTGHLWYLHMAVGLFLITPGLRIFCKYAGYSERLYIIIISFVISSFYSYYLSLFGGMKDTISFMLFVYYICYYLCGYHLRLLDAANISSKLLILIIIICFLTVVFGTGLLRYVPRFAGLSFTFYGYASVPVIIMSISIFILVSKLKYNENFRSSFVGKKIVSIAPYTLGIYVTHPIFIRAVRTGVAKAGISLNMILYIIFASISVFFFSYAFSYLLMKIPYLKRII